MRPQRGADRRRGPLSSFDRPGLSEGKQRALDIVLVIVIALFTGGWGLVVMEAAASGRGLRIGGEVTTSPLSTEATPPVSRVLDRLLAAVRPTEWRGHSGAVRAVIVEPSDSLDLAEALGLDSLPPGVQLEEISVDSGPEAPRAADRSGVFNVLLRLRDQARQVTDVTLMRPVPTDLLENGRLGDYLVGDWPIREERPSRLRTEQYDPPTGLIAVTPRNRDVRVTEHLTLGDFLTKGQVDVWPKYVAITPALLDKVELTIQELERAGHPVDDVGVISGFRTPYYNAHGGSTSGRGSVSRHMYGDALDFYIDNDGDGRMDDLNGDGSVDIGDARLVARAADRVEERYPEYVGGIGTYSPRPGAHAGFVHVDARGYRARW